MVHFVGAGPGAPDLITVRGKQYLEEADVIIYAGSLVNPQLLEYSKDVCTIHNSAKMTLEEVISVIENAEAEGKMTVRLHTGDPCIYGAIREQMDILDEKGISYDYCPGVSAFCGAASALNLEYTLPGDLTERDHHQNGRTYTGSEQREHPVFCGTSGNHGRILEYRNARRTEQTTVSRRLHSRYTGSDRLQGNLAG